MQAAFDAFFRIPENASPGEYTGYFSRGIGPPSPLNMFVSPSQPNEMTVTIIPEVEWKDTIFTVDCKMERPVWQRPCGWVGVRSQKEINVALLAAAENGGGIVVLPRGQYYIDGPIIIPNNVRLRGESRELTSIYFREDNPDTAPAAYITSNGTKFAIEKLTVYVSHFYHSIIFVASNVTNFEMFETRVRAVAYASWHKRATAPMEEDIDKPTILLPMSAKCSILLETQILRS